MVVAKRFALLLSSANHQLSLPSNMILSLLVTLCAIQTCLSQDTVPPDGFIFVVSTSSQVGIRL